MDECRGSNRHRFSIYPVNQTDNPTVVMIKYRAASDPLWNRMRDSVNQSPYRASGGLREPPSLPPCVMKQSADVKHTKSDLTSCLESHGQERGPERSSPT